MKCHVYFVSVLLLTASCRSASEAPQETAQGAFTPQQGEWTASNFTLTASGCDYLAEEEDEALFDPNMNLSVTDTGFTFQMEDLLVACTLSDQDFVCEDATELFDLADGDGNATLTANRAQEGAFSSTTAAVVDFIYEASCEGADCDYWNNYWELDVPCATAGSFDLSIGGGTASTTSSTEQGALGQAQQCEVHLGPVPGFNCADAIPVPITVGGVAVDQDQQPGACDAPSIAEGDCNVGTRVGRLSGTNEDGSVRDDVVWAYLCRKYDGIVQLIGTNEQSGATCFFESEANVASRFDGLTVEDGIVMGDIAGSKDADYEATWKVPDEVASQRCWSCHAADPYVHTPYIDGARLESDTSQPVIPNITGPNTPYFLVGEAFESRVASEGGLVTLHIDGNNCVSCHRFIDPATFGFQGGPQLDANETMPPYDPGSLSQDYQDLLECSENGPGNTPGCDWVAVPGEDD
jgi:hypothetical protein